MGGDLLLFINHQGTVAPLTLPSDSTVADLLHAVTTLLRVKGVRLTYQAKPLGPPATPLADTGLSNESTIEASGRPEPPPELLEPLKAAQAGLGTVAKQNLQEIRAFARPPPLIEEGFHVLLLMLGSKETDWAAAKKRMAQTTFIKEMQDADPEELYKRLTNPKKTARLIRAKISGCWPCGRSSTSSTKTGENTIQRNPLCEP
eukprot:Hpha_TRINITY_DN15860_c4_g1::TRINITY_DN15860_c4_g1_i1::g.190244::m.190244